MHYMLYTAAVPNPGPEDSVSAGFHSDGALNYLTRPLIELIIGLMRPLTVFSS